MDIGKVIKIGRIKKNIKQKDLSKKIEVHNQELCDWENGRKIPRGDSLIKLMQELGIETKNFAEDEEDEIRKHSCRT